jgi:hypothetical protein
MRPGQGDRGAVTAEAAMALPALVLVLAAGLWAISVVAAQLACVDAARAGTRAAARGEPLEAVRAAALKAAPPQANASVEQQGDLFKVRVSAVVRPNWAAVMPSITVSATAFSPGESTHGGAPGGPPAPPVGEERGAATPDTGPAAEAPLTAGPQSNAGR